METRLPKIGDQLLIYDPTKGRTFITTPTIVTISDEAWMRVYSVYPWDRVRIIPPIKYRGLLSVWFLKSWGGWCYADELTEFEKIMFGI